MVWQKQKRLPALQVREEGNADVQQIVVDEVEGNADVQQIVVDEVVPILSPVTTASALPMASRSCAIVPTCTGPSAPSPM